MKPNLCFVTDRHWLILSLGVATLFIVAMAANSQLVEWIRFDNDPVGKSPPGWQATLTGQGNPKWEVVQEKDAPSGKQVLRQSGTAAFPLCLKNETSLKDGSVEVKFKPISGKKDQAAGIVWRAKDARNYYIVRANALEDNVVLYKVQNGQRNSLDIVGRVGGYGVSAKVPRGQWSTLKVTFQGPRFGVLLNGKKLFEVIDKTFTNAGQIGLWTKADSVTVFDDFKYGPP